MDSFRNFMENNQYLKGGATPSATPSSSGLPTLPKDDKITNLVGNAAALVDKDARLTEADAALAARVENLEEAIKKLATKEEEERNIQKLTGRLDALESAVKQISELLLKLAN